MEIDELKDKILEAGPASDKWVAVYIAILAVILAIAHLGGAHAMKDAIDANISVANTYGFFQAKSIRETNYRLTAEQLKLALLAEPGLGDAAHQQIEAKIGDYLRKAESYESDPASGEGKLELQAKAHGFEVLRDYRQRQDRYFDYAEALLQIAIVLASISIVTGRNGVRWLSLAMATVGAVLMLDAFTMLAALPFL
jgi:hypothetical protein